jgi:2-phosphoglycerate kinase
VQVYIKNEEKHAERMAVRARCMAMDPARNKYVRNMPNIRAIQEHLVRSADKAKIPKINNSNGDASVTTIHATILAVLQRCGLAASLKPGSLPTSTS